jgi:hypothetical protein
MGCPGVSAVQPGPPPAGIRPIERAPDDTGAGRLRWVTAGSLVLELGDRVVVRERDREWLGEVVVPPDRLVEWPEQDGLPIVVRRASAAEWPVDPAQDGTRLLESLALPPELLVRRRPDSAAESGLPGPGPRPTDPAQQQ